MKAAHLDVGNVTDIGLNPALEHNEDYYGRFDGEYGTLLIVCDGMGGGPGGEIASRIAVDAIQSYIARYHIPTEENMIIAQSFEHAQKKIMEKVNEDPSLSGMGSTVVLLLIREHQFWYAHLGDSRLYLRRDDSLTRLTRDHSEVQNLVDLGIIKPEDAAHHPRRNIVSKALGHDIGDPEISGPHRLYQDDIFMLCSDGVSDYIADDEILDYLTESPQVAAHNLVDEAKLRGGMDNLTIQIVHVLHGSGKAMPEPEVEVTNRPPLNIKKYVVPLLIVILGIYILVQIPRACSKMIKKDKTSISKKRGAKAGDEADIQPDASLDNALNKRLKAGPPDSQLQTFLTDFCAANPSKKLPKTLFSFPIENDGASVYVTPGLSIYLAFNHLANTEKVNREYLEYIVMIAAAVGELKSGTVQPQSVEEFFGGTTTALDANTLARARELYLNKDKNKGYDFKRIGDKLNSQLRITSLSIHYK